MDPQSDVSSSPPAVDPFEKLALSSLNDKGRSITVKFTTNDGTVFTQTYSSKIKISEIKDILEDVFGTTADNMLIKEGRSLVSDDKVLNEFNVGDFNMLELYLYSKNPDFTISATNAYKEFATVPDVITVHMLDSDAEDGWRDIVVEMMNQCIEKPFIGGYVNKDSGVEYHHGYSQTGPPKPKVHHTQKSHRDTQTYFLRNRLLDTNYAQATQMAKEDLWIPSITDRILVAGPYETAEEWEKRRDVERKVRTIQRYFRAWKIRKALKELCAEYKKRIRLEEELNDFYKQADEDRKAQELVGKVFPRTKEDFIMLYAMVDRWKKSEIKRICYSYSGPAKISSFFMLLDKEIQMLRAIEAHRHQIKMEMKIKKEHDFFKTIGNPIEWNKHYKDWTNKAIDFNIQMDTLETQQGNEYYNIFLSLNDIDVGVEEKIQALLNLKLLLCDHNCYLSNELVELIDRACELMVRGINRKHLDILMKRIKGLFIKHIKTPECNNGVCKRMLRIKEKIMHSNLYCCNRCGKLKCHSEFPANSQLEKFQVCLTCTWDDRVMEPWVDVAPYRFILRLIRHEEKLKLSESSIAFILQPKDIHYIVVKIWHGHSALTEVTDIYNLRLCRWFIDQEWAPWNCVLLTTEEMKVHYEIKNLEDVYDLHFLHRVFNKHELAKQHFKIALKLENYFQEVGENTKRWHEIKNFKEFIAVHSKTHVFAKCH
ncbi:hypothetical protein PPYR_01705 [Photinus pyralis]|uniref:IQ motif and ubiquitin-like domain-containing protein n=2 Tax=Photinus pyralis TaxID=7054 RepID=A0A5N4B548_PHOPY|nr:hypothetical protein PPYR_01705 [Photinus pyralis]